MGDLPVPIDEAVSSEVFHRQLTVADWKCGPAFFAWSVTNP
jgi:hypothetical protein